MRSEKHLYNVAEQSHQLGLANSLRCSARHLLPAGIRNVQYMMPAVRLSDHASFWDQGYKAVMITDTAFFRNPHYHLPSDTMEKLDYRFMAELVESLIAFFKSHHRQ